jgi:hypothetical protein
MNLETSIYTGNLFRWIFYFIFKYRIALFYKRNPTKPTSGAFTYTYKAPLTPRTSEVGATALFSFISKK